MGTDNSEFAKKLLATFQTEAQEHLNAIASGLIELEKPISAEQHIAALEVIFRETHTLKGAARSVDLPDIEEICHVIEDVFSAAKREKIVLSRDVFNYLHDAVTVLETLLKEPGPDTRATLQKRRDLMLVLANISQGIPIPPDFEKVEGRQPELTPQSEPVDEPLLIPPKTPDIQANTVRISTNQLDSLMLQTEDLGDGKRAAAQRSVDLEMICRDFLPWKRRWGRTRASLMPLRRRSQTGIVRKGSEREGSELIKIIEFLDYNAEFVLNLETKLVLEKTRARFDHQFLLERTDKLKSGMWGLLMMPASSVLEIFPRFVREFSHDKEKLIDLEIVGSEIVIDRRILEEMKDALIHLIRNAIDHGIEKPDLRVMKGKKPSGTIHIDLSVFEGKKVEILISDDGAGIDPSLIREAALKKGIITQEDYNHIPSDEIVPLIFESGLSTSHLITDASGRGLGLAIVMEKVNHIGGSITTETAIDKGTSFRITIPSRIATFKGLVVHESQQTFVFPMSSVERVLRMSPTSIKNMGQQNVFPLQEEQIPLVGLGKILGIPRTLAAKAPRMISVVVINHAGRRLGISVEEIGYVQDVMIKGLGGQLARVHCISSATVLGTGKVVPVLNIGDLMKTASNIGRKSAAPSFSPQKGRGDENISILVVDDSITSRMLLKNILDSGGYLVTTAVDGIDALSKLKSGSFNMVVSDVDMPRMNGFILTEKIRSDTKLSEIPIILVTALDSQKDREWGIDVGANAYIVKSGFNQSILLDVVRKLVGR
ncbi:MAG: response regulator [Methanobacteriota archaeon]